MSQKQQSKKAAPPPSNPRQFYLLLAVLGLLGAGVIVYLVQRPKNVSIPIPANVLAADTAGFRGYFLGSADAKLEVTEYADFQCPACQRFEMVEFDVIKRELIDKGIIRWRYRDFPLDQLHPHARLSAHAAACGDEQGKFWELHRIIYERQPDWAPSRGAAGLFRDYAKQAGLDQGKYDECMQSAKFAGRIEASLKEGTAIGVGSTPSFAIGGRLYRGSLTSDSLIAAVARAIVDTTK